MGFTSKAKRLPYVDLRFPIAACRWKVMCYNGSNLRGRNFL